VVVLLTPPALAVIVTGVDVETPVVTAVNVAELLPTGTLTEVGTATSDVLPFAMVTANAPEIALDVSVTLHVLDWPPVTEAGEQETPLSPTVG
jgi:hypothetical protein